MEISELSVEELLASIASIQSSVILIRTVSEAHRKGATTAIIAAARKCGEPAIRHLLRLDRKLTNDAKDRLAEGRITLGHARALAGWDSEAKQNEMLQRCMSGNWSVRTLERAKCSDPNSQSIEVAAAEYERLAAYVGVQTGYPCTFQTDKTNSQSGKLQLAFNSYAELDGILRRLRVNMDDWN